jgi:phosphoribosylanthranilate isomerase
VFVKICGITREEDARAAVDAGASAIGFVFWPNSPRMIDPERARAISSVLPQVVQTIGVFVNQPVAEVNDIAGRAALDVVQLHGDEPVEYLNGLNRPAIKALGVSGGAADESDWPINVLILLDAHDPDRRGGTGRTIDWGAAARIAARRPTILAGGLSPETVSDAVRQVRPFGIDVSSGVEQAPGIKDHRRIQALFEALHEHGGA